jgi:hypothetical protein
MVIALEGVVMHKKRRMKKLTALLGMFCFSIVSMLTSRLAISADLAEGVHGNHSGGQRLEVHGPIELTGRDMPALFAGRTARLRETAKPGSGAYSSQRPSARKIMVASPSSIPKNDRTTEGLATKLPQTPSATVSWQATGVTGGEPADAQIAVSNTHVVVTANTELIFYNKAGVNLGAIHMEDFFKPLLALPVGPNYQNDGNNDLRVIFDEYRKRFWVAGKFSVGLDNTNTTTCREIVAVAVSKTQNPLEGWYRYWWDGVAQWGESGGVYEQGDAIDYPVIGIDKISFHQTNVVARSPSEPGCNQGPPKAGKDGDYKYRSVVFMPADSLASGVWTNGWRFWDLQNPDGTPAWLVQPVVHHGNSFGQAYYVSTWYKWDDTNKQYIYKLLIWRLSDPLMPNQNLERVDLDITPPWFNDPVDAPQRDSPTKIFMTNLATDVMKAVYRNGFLHLVTHDAREWFGDGDQLTSIRLVRVFVLFFPSVTTVDPTFINRTFGKNNSIDDKPGARVYYGWPAVEVNKAGNMVIVYARSGVGVYPEVRFSAYFGGEPDIRSSRLLRKGDGPRGDPNCLDKDGNPCVYRWGDTAGASVDPKDDTAIWIAQQYADGKGGWEIWVGKVFGVKYADWFFASEVVVDRPSVISGQRIEISGKIGNQGDGAAPTTRVALYLSRDSGQDIPIAKFQQARLGPGTTADFRVKASVPRGTPSGDYAVKVVIDSPKRFDEYSKDNNIALSTQRVRIGSN